MAVILIVACAVVVPTKPICITGVDLEIGALTVTQAQARTDLNAPALFREIIRRSRVVVIVKTFQGSANFPEFSIGGLGPGNTQRRYTQSNHSLFHMLMIEAIPTPTRPAEAGRRDIVRFKKDTVNINHRFFTYFYPS